MASDLSTLVRAQALQQLRGPDCGCRKPAQGGLLDIQWPWNVRDLIKSADADYERVNASAKGKPGWDEEYKSWKRFYEDNRDPGFLSSSYATVEEVRRRQSRLAEWQQKLQARGTDTGPVVTPSKPDPLMSPSAASDLGSFAAGLSNALKWAVVGVGLWAGVKALGLAEGVQKKG